MATWSMFARLRGIDRSCRTRTRGPQRECERGGHELLALGAVCPTPLALGLALSSEDQSADARVRPADIRLSPRLAAIVLVPRPCALHRPARDVARVVDR